MTDDAGRQGARMPLGRTDALVVVDVQNDFMPQGALGVPQGDVIVPGVNRLMGIFSGMGLAVVLTQDWHPAGHRSFASAHRGRRPMDLYDEPGIGQVLWPDHCVQGTSGADFHRGLEAHLAHAVIRKGWRRDVDSYSGFIENDRRTSTGLKGYLRDRSVERIFVCGLALDYCVFFTAVDGADLGFEVVVLLDLTRAVGSPPEGVQEAMRSMELRGVAVSSSDAVIPGAPLEP